MPNPVNGLANVSMPRIVGTDSASSLPRSIDVGQNNGTDGPSFGRMLLDAVDTTAEMQHTAQAGIDHHLIGGDVPTTKVLTDLKKADLALRALVQIRNKLMEAYDEIRQLRM